MCKFVFFIIFLEKTISRGNKLRKIFLFYFKWTGFFLGGGSFFNMNRFIWNTKHLGIFPYLLI